MSKLWKKNDNQVHPLIEAYTVGEDYLLDQVLLPFDIQASIAHAEGLEKIGILSAEELQQLTTALQELLILQKKGQVEIRIQDEDGHTVIEQYLVELCGEVGKKIHTGRSRNDQVLVALRMYSKDQLKTITEEVKQLSKACFSFAKNHEMQPLPGYTHTQQAMLSSVGHWSLSFVDSLLDDFEMLNMAAALIDQSPLGSAAGYGVSMPLPRKEVAQSLGFRSVQLNSLYCQASKGKFESYVLEAVLQTMLTLGRFANDMLLYTTQEFDFFSVDDALLTGSSIMPQKKNHDALEILRGNVSRVMANKQLILSLSKGLISGYNRDLQLLKKPLMESFEILMSSLQVVNLYIDNMTPNAEQIEAKLSPGIFAADIANTLVKEQGIAFRDAYQQAMKQLEQETDLEANLKSKVSLGAPGNLKMDLYEKRLNSL